MKIKIKSIEITRAEGPNGLTGVLKEFKDFSSVRGWLFSYSHTFPKVGYDKHDFKITWEDGKIYEGRLDCKNCDCENSNLDLKTHVRDGLLIQSGRWKPYWMSKETWKMLQSWENEKQEANKMLEKYEI